MAQCKYAFVASLLYSSCGELWCAVCQECVPVVAVILFLGLYFFFAIYLSFIWLSLTLFYVEQCIFLIHFVLPEFDTCLHVMFLLQTFQLYLLIARVVVVMCEGWGECCILETCREILQLHFLYDCVFLIIILLTLIPLKSAQNFYDNNTKIHW